MDTARRGAVGITSPGARRTRHPQCSTWFGRKVKAKRQPRARWGTFGAVSPLGPNYLRDRPLTRYPTGRWHDRQLALRPRSFRLRTYSGPGLLGKVLWVTPYPGIIESRVTPYTAHPGSTPRRPESTPSPYSPTAALIADAAARNRCKSRRTAPGRYTNRQLPRDFPAGASYVAISGENVAFSRESTLLRPTRPPFRARVGYSLPSPLLRAGRE